MFPRALCWTRLFPSDVDYVCDAAPPWLDEGLKEVQSGGSRKVFVTGLRPLAEMPSLDSFYGVVVLDAPSSLADRLRQAGFASVRRFAAVPGWKDLRSLIPLGCPAASSAAFGLHAPVHPAARLKNLAVRTVARSGSSIWFRNSILIAQREQPAIERTLAEIFTEQLEIAVSTSNAKSQHNRKLLLAAFDRRGGTLGFAKLSLSPDSTRRIVHEGEMLRLLAQRLGHNVGVPRLLFDGQADQSRMIVTSPVAGKVPSGQLTDAHRKFLGSLQSSDYLPVTNTRLFQALRERAAKIDNKECFGSWLERLTPFLSGVVAPATIVHRDFAPWNLRQRDGSIAAFDWETSEPEGLPLLDETHHILVVAYFLERRKPEQAANLLQNLALSRPLGMTPAEALAMQIIYLIDHLCSLSEDGYSTSYPKYVWWRRVLGEITEAAQNIIPSDGLAARGPACCVPR